MRGQLKSMGTVGQILDVMKFSVKMLLVENCVGDIGIILLNEIFQLLPKNWEEDPVKVRSCKQFIIPIIILFPTFFFRLHTFLYDLRVIRVTLDDISSLCHRFALCVLILFLEVNEMKWKSIIGIPSICWLRINRLI